MFQREMSGMENAATALQLRFESAVLEQKKLHSLACKGIENKYVGFIIQNHC